MTNLEKFLEKSKQVRGAAFLVQNFPHTKENNEFIYHACTTSETKDEMIRVMAKHIEVVQLHATCGGVTSIDSGWLWRRCDEVLSRVEALARVEELAK